MTKRKIRWIDVRDRIDAWGHIKSSIDGDKDTATCTVCGVTVDLDGAKRNRPLLLLARTHFYKHKLGPTLPPRQAEVDLQEPPLF